MNCRLKGDENVGTDLIAISSVPINKRLKGNEKVINGPADAKCPVKLRSQV